MQLRSRFLALWAFIGVLSVFGVSGASAQGWHLHAVLVGGNETPAAGHPTAYGTAAVTFRGTSFTQVCVAFVVTGLTVPTSAHIHRGFGPQAGPIVVVLPTPAAGNPGFSSGCVTITAQLSLEIRANPAKFYINVHTAAPYTGGALRGQLYN
jgi:hypothetical protein